MKSTYGPRAMLSRFTIRLGKHYAPSWFNCLIACLFWAVRHVVFYKAWEMFAIGRKDSNCVGILSDQGKAATASNLSEYTVHFRQL